MPKCGTVSLENYLTKRFPEIDVVRVEQIWKGKEGLNKVLQQWPGFHYVIILRNNVERIWSGYHYFDMYDKMTLEEYLTLEIEGTRLGIMNPINQGNYKVWIDNFSPLKPIITTLEEVRELPDFPHDNITKEKPDITNSDKDLIISYLSKMEIEV